MAFCVLIFLTACVISLEAQREPSHELVSDIYQSAPPLVQAALRSVGFPSNSRFISNPELQKPKFTDNQPSSKSGGRKVILPSFAPANPNWHVPKSPQLKQGPIPPSIASKQPQQILRRGESPFVLIRPISIANRRRNSPSKSGGKIVLALPDDNIHILSAESVGEFGRGPNLIPTTLTIRQLGGGDDQTNERKKKNRNRNPGLSTVKYSSQIPTPPNRYQESQLYNNYRNRNHRYQYNLMSMSQNDKHEDDLEESNQFFSQASSNDQETSFEDYEDLIHAGGGHVTLIKAQKASMPKLLQAQRVSGNSASPMKAILIQPKEIKAKRFTVVKTNSRQVTPMKATFVKANPIRAIKSNAQPVSVKTATIKKAKTHRNDKPTIMGSSDAHMINMEPPQMETGESRLLGDPGMALLPDSLSSDDENQIPIDLHCGGNNDLGWCDLGPHYPISEVSQIMEVCEELVNRMYVETPGENEVLEDTLAYSMSHNITDHFSRRWDSSSWKWDVKHSLPFQGTLCDIQRSYIRPSFAQDIKGKWHVIIQTDRFPQRVPLEVCKNPGEACSQDELCNRESQCVQKYTYQHLISFDPESAETCPFIRLYKFPTSCTCRIPANMGQ